MLSSYPRLTKTAFWTWLICSFAVVVYVILFQSNFRGVLDFLYGVFVLTIMILVISGSFILGTVFLSQWIYGLYDSVERPLHPIFYFLVPLSIVSTFLVLGYLLFNGDPVAVGDIFLWVYVPYFVVAVMIYGILSLRRVPLAVDQ
jgi:lipid-A-disaccharide synthase-like uncharacterized protein